MLPSKSVTLPPFAFSRNLRFEWDGRGRRQTANTHKLNYLQLVEGGTRQRRDKKSVLLLRLCLCLEMNISELLLLHDRMVDWREREKGSTQFNKQQATKPEMSSFPAHHHLSTRSVESLLNLKFIPWSLWSWRKKLQCHIAKEYVKWLKEMWTETSEHLKP